MPPKRKTTKRKVRRTKRSAGPVAVVSPMHPIPQIYKTTLKYSELITLSYTGTNTVYQFNLNNLNDPNRSGTGHQPNGYDQISTLYTKTRVTGAKYSITFSNASATYQAEVLTQLCPNATTSSTFADAVETQYTKRLTLDPYGAESKTTSATVNIAKLFGISQATLRSDDQYIAGIGGNPAEQCCLNIWVQNISTATAITVYARVNIIYTVEFFEAKIFSQS